MPGSSGARGGTKILGSAGLRRRPGCGCRPARGFDAGCGSRRRRGLRSRIAASLRFAGCRRARRAVGGWRRIGGAGRRRRGLAVRADYGRPAALSGRALARWRDRPRRRSRPFAGARLRACGLRRVHDAGSAPAPRPTSASTLAPSRAPAGRSPPPPARASGRRRARRSPARSAPSGRRRRRRLSRPDRAAH